MSGLDITQYSTQAVILVATTSFILLISQNWRWSLGGLLFQYVGVFLLVNISWPMSMAFVKLIAGWISCLVLGMAVLGVRSRKSSDTISGLGIEIYSNIPVATNVSGFLFHILAAGLIGLAILSILPSITMQFPEIQITQLISSLILMGLGLLHLGFTNQPLKVFIGLLTVLAGFEIVYAAVEYSTLVAGLLSGVNLCLATLGAYAIVNPTIEVAE